MYGEQVSKEELNQLLKKRETVNAANDVFLAEIRAIQPGKCLRYKLGSTNPMLASFALKTAATIEGLSSIEEGGYLYIYRPEKT